MSVEPTWQEARDPRQYITSVSGGGRTYGSRYIFGHIDRTTISVRLRANLTFTPNLTLEGYAEPFVASGRYSRVGELVAPRSAQLREYGTDGTTVTTWTRQGRARSSTGPRASRSTTATSTCCRSGRTW
jgi:hypothetical protein